MEGAASTPGDLRVPSPPHPAEIARPAFDWTAVARVALASRLLDELEETELGPRGLVPYQFSTRGHELGQALLACGLDHPHDAASVYYRSRAFMLGCGLTLEEALAAGMARTGAVSDGRDIGATFNLPRRGGALVLPMAGDVGSGFTPAVGWAQALRYRADVLGEEDRRGAIAVAFGGDGAVATNGFWSALTIATTLELPVLFVIEDNGYAISVTSSRQTPGANIAANLASFANLLVLDGSGTRPDVTASMVAEAIAHVRAWRRPALLRLVVPRLAGHTRIDTQAYKPPLRLEEERQRDPIPALEEFLVPRQLAAEKWRALQAELRAAVREAAARAAAQPEPDPAGVTRYAFAAPDRRPPAGGMAAERAGTPVSYGPRLGMAEALRRTLDHELAANPRVLVFGEDVGAKGGVHAVTKGLMTRHGAQRVFDTSLSEEGIVGRAAGLAYAGLVPVAEIQFRKYVDAATEQLHNAGTVRWRTANAFAAPMVVRVACGFRTIGDPWHSSTGESDLAHAVGWRVAFPSNAEDAVGLLRSALRGEDPVILLEHRALLDAEHARRPYPGDDFVLPFGRARIVAGGDAATVVTWGAMVERCLAARRDLGASIDVVDLRTIAPWDREAVLGSVRRTGRCLVVHEDIEVCGFGAEVAATVAAEGFAFLDAPVLRLGAPPVPVPFNRRLMDAVVPTVAAIRAKLEELLGF